MKILIGCYWLVSSLLELLGFSPLSLVPHLSPLQLPHQGQHLSGGLISPGPVDQRAVSLQHQVRVLPTQTLLSLHADYQNQSHELNVYIFYSRVQFFLYIYRFVLVLQATRSNIRHGGATFPSASTAACEPGRRRTEFTSLCLFTGTQLASVQGLDFNHKRFWS